MIGVVRISGHEAQRLAIALTGRLPRERYAELSEFRDADGTIIDRGIALFFRGPRSYTGEDVLEMQAHGGVAILRMLLRRFLGSRFVARYFAAIRNLRVCLVTKDGTTLRLIIHVILSFRRSA